MHRLHLRSHRGPPRLLAAASTDRRRETSTGGARVRIAWHHMQTTVGAVAQSLQVLAARRGRSAHVLCARADRAAVRRL